MKGIYYIENTVSEWHSAIVAYFKSLEEAKEALKECNDWWRPKGTGTIYYREFGLGKHAKEIYKVA